MAMLTSASMDVDAYESVYEVVHVGSHHLLDLLVFKAVFSLALLLHVFTEAEFFKIKNLWKLKGCVDLHVRERLE